MSVVSWLDTGCSVHVPLPIRRILAGSLWSTAPTEARTVLISGFLLCKKHMSDRLRQNLWKTKVVESGLGMFKCGQSIHELDMANAHFKCTGQGLDD